MRGKSAQKLFPEPPQYAHVHGVFYLEGFGNYFSLQVFVINWELNFFFH